MIYSQFMSAINILFFSNVCTGSQILITLLKNEGLLRFFHLICTDNNKNIPPAITVTPTLIIRNVPTPYVAGDAFAWVNKMKQWKLNEQMKRMSGLQQQYLQKIAGNLGMNSSEVENIAGFSQEEMSGMSDMFAFWNEENPLQHTYFDCGNIGKEMIYAPPKEESTLSEKKFKENQTKMLQERSKQDAVFKKNIEDFRKQYS